MDAWVFPVLVIVALAVGAAVAWFAFQQRRRKMLQKRFGPEYERTVHEVGERSRAERELERREERVKRLDIRPLPQQERERFANAWQRVQAHFVDSPSDAITEADVLVTEVMQARGYPMGDFEQRAADVSVDHPNVVEHYRAARSISVRNARGEATTEDLRQAMMHYRALFEDLLEPHSSPNAEVRIDRAS